MPAISSYRMKTITQYIISILVVTIVSVTGLFISEIAGYRVVALMLMVSISLLTIFFDIVPILLAALLSALIWDFFFIPPHYKLQVTNTEDALLLLMYFIIVLVNAVMTYKIRKVEKEAMEKYEKEKEIELYNTLLSSLSHELRTPIATIIGATDNLMINAKGLSEKDKHELIEEISTASLRLNQQVENLLNTSRLESGFIQPKIDWCDVNELIYSVVNKLQAQLANHQVKISIADNLPFFKLDFGLMEQVLYNILSNAAQYTPIGSTIFINASAFDYMTNEKLGLDMVATKLVLIISDNGKGFPPHTTKRVFNKFYRLHSSNKSGGTGLGLSIVKGFVEAHKGTIALENVPTGGSKFTITIPAESTYLNALKNE